MAQYPAGNPLSGREDFGCNCYSSGEGVYSEGIMPSAYKHMLGFFQLANDVPGYEEMEFRRPESKEDEEKGRYQDGDGNGEGEGEVVNVSIETGNLQANGGGNAERRSGWVEETQEGEDGLEKIVE